MKKKKEEGEIEDAVDPCAVRCIECFALRSMGSKFKWCHEHSNATDFFIFSIDSSVFRFRGRKMVRVRLGLFPITLDAPST